MIEGIEESTILHLYQDRDFDFSVYVPEDMIAEFDGDFFNVYTNFNDQKMKTLACL